MDGARIPAVPDTVPTRVRFREPSGFFGGPPKPLNPTPFLRFSNSPSNSEKPRNGLKIQWALRSCRFESDLRYFDFIELQGLKHPGGVFSERAVSGTPASSWHRHGSQVQRCRQSACGQKSQPADGIGTASSADHDTASPLLPMPADAECAILTRLGSSQQPGNTMHPTLVIEGGLRSKRCEGASDSGSFRPCALLPR